MATGRSLRPPALLLAFFGLAACRGEFPEASGSKKRPAAGSSSLAPEVGIELRRGREPRELVRIGTRGVSLGPEGGPRVWKFFTEPRRAEDAWYFFRSYAPFEMRSAAGDLRLRGHGKVKPGPAERRMLLEWARQVAVEAAGARGGAAYGLILTWHQGGPAGICEEVVLYLTGEAVATACGWDREVRGRLDPAPLDRVFGWFDRLQPFQTGGDALDESLQMRLIFAGRGAHSATAAERAQIRSFSAALFNELAARRRAAPGLPADEPTAPRLLLPRGAVPPARILLELPEKPPPPPRPPAFASSLSPSPEEGKNPNVEPPR